ncbi:MAG: 50S ribosomal protein L15 [Nitrospirota bacterium]|jgi:large subunit ribosomal protein L15
MQLHEIRPPGGATRSRKRVGRGEATGHGKTSGKGHKGQKARSGGGKGSHFEGGQMPLYRRLPKRGFHNQFRKQYAVVNLRDLARFPDVTDFTPEVFAELGLVKDACDGIKILAEGEVGRRITVRAHKFSTQAAEKLRAAGGSVEVI